ncbi:hypothetical protein [Microbacterium kunmingense]|uniref:hypothetical protein n=1 Tax=Microbacterium kunmingense TaxID=2915939 RepID=UPI003D73B3D6
MASARDAVPRGLRVTVWTLALCFAVLGVVLFLVTGSGWPLVAFLGVAVPMVPLGRRRGAATLNSEAHRT